MASFSVAECSRFLVVGVGATLVHSAVYMLAAPTAGAVWANLLGFVCAVGVSFVGHGCWTFRNATGSALGGGNLLRFAVTAVSGLALNTLAVTVVTVWLGWHYALALPFIVFVTPGATFMLSKFWAFRCRTPGLEA